MNSRLDDLKQNVSSNPTDPRAHFELGCAAQMHGDLELALECFTKVTQLAETVAVGHFNLGNVCFNLKRWPQAVAAFQRAFKLDPDRSTLNNLGNSLAAMGDFEQAIAQYELALTLPDDGTGTFRVLKNLGMACQADGDWRGAASAYQRAIADPADNATVDPTPILLQLTKLLARVDAAQAMLALKSHHIRVSQSADLLAVQADCLTNQHALTEALQCLMQACDLAPDQPTVLASLGRHYLMRGRHFESLVCLHRALAGGELTARTHSAWLSSQLCQEPIDWQRFKHEAERWTDVADDFADDFADVAASEACTVTAQRDELEPGFHLGIVGGSTAYRRLALFLQPLIDQAGPQNYQLSFYVDGDTIDAVEPSSRVRWVDSRWLGDNRLGRMIESDKVDILIDLTGHADDGRLGVFARRSAPLQLSWAGWLATTGLNMMDFVIADKTAIHDSHREAFTESVLTLPGSMFCVMPPTMAKPLATPPTTDMTSPVFGSVCSPAQLADKLVGTWCKLLRQLPSAKLKLTDPAYQSSSLVHELAEKFRTREVEVERIEFVASKDTSAFLQSIQVTLDPFPWNRAEVTCQSLCVGTPVVAWLGDRLSSRTSASVLKAAGFDHWIAESPDAYCQLVQSLVYDRVAPLEIMDQVKGSSLCDTATWVHEFIDALRRQTNRFVHGSLG